MTNTLVGPVHVTGYQEKNYILFYYYLTLQNQSWDSTEVRPLSLKIHIILKVTGSPSYRYSNMLFNLYFSL